MISLQTIRSHKFLKWPTYFFFGLLIISFIFFYGFQKDQSRQQEIDFAKIRSDRPFHRWDNLTSADMLAARRSLKQGMSRFIPRELQQQIGEDSLNALIALPDEAREAANMALIDRASREKGIRVTSQDIAAYFQAQPGLTPEVAQYVANQEGFDSVAAWADSYRRTTEQNSMKALVGKLAHASLFELWQEYLIDKEKITLELAAYPAKDFESQVVVTEADLVKYLADHKEEFHVEPHVQYAYVSLSKEKLRDKVKPTDDQLKAYYQQHQADYHHVADVKADELIVSIPDASTSKTQAAMAFLASIRDRAAQSQNWTTFSTQLEVQNPEFIVFGHATQPIPVNSTNYSPEYIKALTTLKADEVSSPILEAGRPVLLRVKEKRPEGVPPLEEVKSRVEAAYVESQIDEQFKQAYDQWKTLRKDNNDIASFAKAVQLQDELTTSVEQSASVIPGIGNLMEQADYIRSLEANQLSDPIQTTSLLAMLQIKNMKEGYDPPLAEIRDKVEAAVRAAGSYERARLTAQQNLAVIRTGADFKTSLADAPIKPLISPPITRTEPVAALGTPLQKFRQEAASLKTGAIGMSPYGNDPQHPMGYALWKVVSVQEPTKAEFSKERFQFMQQYLQIQQLSVIQEWLADQRKKADFTILDAALPKENE